MCSNGFALSRNVLMASHAETCWVDEHFSRLENFNFPGISIGIFLPIVVLVVEETTRKLSNVCQRVPAVLRIMQHSEHIEMLAVCLFKFKITQNVDTFLYHWAIGEHLPSHLNNKWAISTVIVSSTWMMRVCLGKLFDTQMKLFVCDVTRDSEISI